MKKYIKPSIELVEFDLENSVLTGSPTPEELDMMNYNPEQEQL